MHKLLNIISITLASFFFCSQLLAEEIRVPVGQQSQKNVVAPKTGLAQGDVISQFGAPIKRSASVGSPPITRWEYSKFYVYFEYDRVIHSVIKI